MADLRLHHRSSHDCSAPEDRLVVDQDRARREHFGGVDLPLVLDRLEAGRRLVRLIRFETYAPVVVGLGPGGLAVGAPIAHALRAPLEILVVAELELGDRYHPRTYVGAIDESGRTVMHPEVSTRLDAAPGALDAAVATARQTLRRQSEGYRGGAHPLPLAGRQVVLVDDGTSSLSLVHAALELIRAADPAELVLALPSVPREALEDLEESTDLVVCTAVLEWWPWFKGHVHLYEDDRVPTAAEVRRLLAGSA